MALSTALHDLAAQRAGVPLHRFWGLDAARAPQSTFTIGIDTSEKMQAKVREAASYPILKVKLGTDRDVEILRALREVTDREIRVDANCAWTARQAIRMLPGAGGVRRHRAGTAGGSRRSRRIRHCPGAQ